MKSFSLFSLISADTSGGQASSACRVGSAAREAVCGQNPSQPEQREPRKPRGCLSPHPPHCPPMPPCTAPLVLSGRHKVSFSPPCFHTCASVYTFSPSSISIWFKTQIQNSPHPCWIPCLVAMFSVCVPSRVIRPPHPLRRLISQHTLSGPTLLSVSITLP